MGDYPPGVTGKDIDRLEGRQDCCETCKEYSGDYCMREWNNLDECYKDEDRDKREPDDWCDYYEEDESL